MGAFEYQALDAAGKSCSGIVQGDTARAVRQALRERGLVPIQVTPVAGQSTAVAASGVVGRGGRGLSTGERALLTRQFATLVRAGLPLDETLAALAEQSESGLARRQLAAVRARLLEGASLAQSLAAFPQSFDELYCAAVAAGEATGRLDQVLEQLADYGEQSAAFGQRVAAAMIYPTLLLMMSLAVTAGLLAYVVPRVITVFEGLESRLPLPTRLLLGVSDLVQAYGGIAALVLALALLAGLALLRRPAPRLAFDRRILRLPLAGPLLGRFDEARLARTLAIATGAAVPVLEALTRAVPVLRNHHLRQQLATVAGRVREGAALSAALRDSGAFSNLLVRLVASGEKSGELARMLAHAAELAERRVQAALTLAVALIEPAMIVTMGGIVLFIVLAILLPIFSLDQLLGVGR